MNIEWNKVTWYTKLGAVVMVVIVVLLGFYFWNEYKNIQALSNSLPSIQVIQDSQVSKSEKEPTDSEPKDLRTYRNEEFGFEVKYPPEYDENKYCSPHIVSSREEDSLIFLGPIIFRLINPEGLSLTDYVNGVAKEIDKNSENYPVSKVISQEITMIGGRQAIKLHSRFCGVSCGEPIGLYVEYTEKILKISYDDGVINQCPVGSITLPSVIAKEILSTFRFIEKELTVEGYMDIDITSWDTYRDDMLGFEFQYPVDSFVREENSDGLSLRSIRKSNDGIGSSLVIGVGVGEQETKESVPEFITEVLDKRLDFANLKSRFESNVRGNFLGDPPRGTYYVEFAIPGQDNNEVNFSFDISNINEPVYGGFLEDQKIAARILSTFRFIE